MGDEVITPISRSVWVKILEGAARRDHVLVRRQDSNLRVHIRGEAFKCSEFL
jgi:hypothetical protein